MDQQDDCSNLEKLISNFNYIKKFCSNNKSDKNDEISLKCDKLLQFAESIDKISDKYDFENLHANGFLFFNRFLVKFSNHLINDIKTKNKFDYNFTKIFDLVFTYKEIIEFTYNILEKEHDSNSQDRKSLITKEFLLSSKEFYQFVYSNEDVRPLIFSDYLGFWLNKSNSKALNFIFKWLAINSKLPYSLISLFSSKKAGDYFIEAFKNCDLHNPFDSFHGVENFFTSKILKSIVTFRIPVTSKTIYVNKQNRYRLHHKGYVLDFENMSTEDKELYFNDKEEQERLNSPGVRYRNSKDTIKCRYSQIINENKIKESLEQIKKDQENGNEYEFLEHFSARRRVVDDGQNNIDPKEESDNKFNKENFLVFYIHGGALFTNGSTSAEIYLRNIVNKLGGVPILSVDYSLTTPFPIPVQELMDVYIWLFSKKDDVKEKLGFHPKKICLFGDSAGGLFCLSLTILLNELNNVISKNGTDSLIPLPYSCVIPYPVITMSQLNISKCFASFELLIECHILLLIVSLYGANKSTIGDFKKISKSEEFQKIASETRKLFEDGLIEDCKVNLPNNINDSSPWFLTDYENYRNCSLYIDRFFKNPIITPALFDRYDELKSINLFVLVGNDDLLIDDSIELCKRWAGNVNLDILNNLMHGFLVMKNLSDETREATVLLIQRLREACKLI